MELLSDFSFFIIDIAIVNRKRPRDCRSRYIHSTSPILFVIVHKHAGKQMIDTSRKLLAAVGGIFTSLRRHSADVSRLFRLQLEERPDC